MQDQLAEATLYRVVFFLDILQIMLLVAFSQAYTVDKRDLMIRPGVRCTDESHPLGVTTVGRDCIGRVVQLTNHARAIYGISVDDRIAAIYPFDYNTDKIRRNTKYCYALVDAGFAVAVPKHVDAAEAVCLIRLYLSAFQSILMGMAGVYKDRYGKDQLMGQSILIQNGHTDFGRALIELAALLGASQIFATGPTECHPLLSELGAIPLGAKTFSWELFLEDKIGLVLVQEMPTEGACFCVCAVRVCVGLFVIPCDNAQLYHTLLSPYIVADNFEQCISILNKTRGNLVYTYHGHKHADENVGSIGSLAEEVGCTSPQELTKKAKEVIKTAKFNLRLTCSPNYIVYEGLWPSCKEKPNQFKEDLRYLFTLLGQGGLKPPVADCITLEEVAGVQDRIEVLGTKGTVVCMPTALYEKKACPNISHESLPRDLHDCFDDDSTNRYAVDAGYVKDTHACDTLTDFHRMHDHSQTFPVVQEATPYPHQNFDNVPGYVLNCSSSTTGSVERGYSESQQEFMHHLSLLMGSNDQDSTGNRSTADLQTKYPTKDPPVLIQSPREKSRRYKAYQQSQRLKLAEVIQTKQHDDLGRTTSFGTKKNDEQSSSVGTTYTSSRKLRRESRKKEKSNAGSSANTTKSPDAIKNDASNMRVHSTVAEESTENGTIQVGKPKTAKSEKPKATAMKGVDRNKIKPTLSEYFSRDDLVTTEKQRHCESRHEDNNCARGDSSSPSSSFQEIRKKWEQK